MARLGLYVKVVGQRSSATNRVLTSLLPSFKVKVRVKVKGRSYGHGSRSNLWHTAINIRGLALPSAAKSKEESLSIRGVCLCVE